MKVRGYRLAVLGVFLLAALFMSSCVGNIWGLGVKSIEINAPVEKVFKYLEDPGNYMTYPPVNGKISNVQGQGLGWTCTINYEYAPRQRINSDFALVDYVPNQQLVFKAGNTVEKNDGAYTFILTPTPDGGTRLVWVSEGSVEVPLFVAITKWGKAKFDREYTKFMDDFAGRMKTELEK